MKACFRSAGVAQHRCFPSDMLKRYCHTTSEHLEHMRQRGRSENSVGPVPSSQQSWVRQDTTYETSSADERQAAFDHQGFLVVKGFADSDECAAMRACMADYIEEWEPGNEAAVFRTDEKQLEAQGSSDYFFGSSNRIHFFAEPDATEESGNLREGISKGEALNKVGHGLHLDGREFERYSTSAKIAELVRALGWKDPVLPQSMYIFKQPSIGGEVTSHQDSSFLYTTPRQSCLGLWLALHPATLDNGCLWVRPGSHNEPVRRKFARKQDFSGEDGLNGEMDFIELTAQPEHTWEGKLPDGSWPPPSDGLFEAGFIPVECEEGDLVVFPGQLDHLSLPNYSSKPRHTFQLHMVEGPSEGVHWDASNWLQYPQQAPFRRVTAPMQ